MGNHNEQLTKEVEQKLREVRFNSVNSYVRLITPEDVPGYKHDFSHLGKTK